MKTRYIVLVVGLIIGMSAWLGYNSTTAYEQCVKAGKQSNETCRLYTY